MITLEPSYFKNANLLILTKTTFSWPYLEIAYAWFSHSHIYSNTDAYYEEIDYTTTAIKTKS